MRVLLVEDSAADARLVREMLKEAGPGSYDVAHVRRVGEAVQRLDAGRFDVVLLDLGLPDAHGLDALQPIRSAMPEIPVVVLSARRDEKLALTAVKAGAQDYLLKGHGDGALLGRALRYAVERKRSEQKVFHLAHHDGLTDLPNRRLLMDRLEQAVARTRREGKLLAVLFLDLDGFKEINDTHGHAAGDGLLQQVAERLRATVRESDTIARLGGDEFTLVFSELSAAADAGRLARKVLGVFDRPFELPTGPVQVSASMGVSLFPEDGETPGLLLRTADAAMYRAKQHGPRICEFHSARLVRVGDERRSVAHGLRRALDAGELVLHYQPRVEAASGRVAGLEALLRWNHPEWGLVAPPRFVPAAEELGLIESIGHWVLTEACRQGREWSAAGDGAPPRIAVNLSSREFAQRNLAERVQRVLHETGFPPEALQLEVTETPLMRHEIEAEAQLRALAALGVRLGIDDFGTGYSSLRRLERLPIHALELDRSFVRGMLDDAGDAAVASATLVLARGLGLRARAAGVETAEQAGRLRDQGWDELQGDGFAAPRPAAAAAAWLASGAAVWP